MWYKQSMSAKKLPTSRSKSWIRVLMLAQMLDSSGNSPNYRVKIIIRHVPKKIKILCYVADE